MVLCSDLILVQEWSEVVQMWSISDHFLTTSLPQGPFVSDLIRVQNVVNSGQFLTTSDHFWTTFDHLLPCFTCQPWYQSILQLYHIIYIEYTIICRSWWSRGAESLESVISTGLDWAGLVDIRTPCEFKGLWCLFVSCSCQPGCQE